MKNRQKIAHMKVAMVYASLSYCSDKKVGAIVVLDNNVISIGYNGTPPGECNECLDEHGKTKENVIHAEHNALKKLKNTPHDLSKAILFCTLSPCINCAILIINSNIKHVIYNKKYKSDDGVKLLIKNNVLVEHLTITT